MTRVNPTELRIGNWVALPVIGSRACVTMVGRGGINIDLDNIDLDPGDDYFESEEVYAIELNAEHLTRLGFTWIPSFKAWRKSNVFLNWRSKRQVFVVNVKMPTMKYVHQLMNYYHAVTGAELTYDRLMVVELPEIPSK